MKPPKDYDELLSRVHAAAYKDKWEARLGLIITLETASARLDVEEHKQNLQSVREAVVRLSYELVRDAIMGEDAA